MENVNAIFEFLKQSSWIEGLDVYGYNEVTPALIPNIIEELSESSWAESLACFKADIEAAGLVYCTVPEMKQIVMSAKNN